MELYYLAHDALLNFKRNGKYLSSSFKTNNFIKDTNRFHKNTLLNEYVKSTTKQLFNLSHSMKIYNKFNIKAFYNINIEENLTPKQYRFYNKCLEYIPKKFDYFLLDFIVSCDNKTLDMDPKAFLNKMAFKCLINSKSVLNGFAEPKYTNTLYKTIPKAFSPLFFNNLEFAGSILKNQKTRKDFYECIDYLFAYKYQSSINNVANSDSSVELAELLNKIVYDFQNNWWVPKELLSKTNQVILYSSNMLEENSLLDVLIIEHIFQNKHNVLNMSPKSILEQIRNNIKKYIYSNNSDLFLSADIKQNFYLYGKLKKLYMSLNNNKKVIVMPKSIHTKLKSVKYFSKFNIA